MPMPRTRDLVRFVTRTTQLCARDGPLALALPVAVELIVDDVQPSLDSLADHGAFKFTERARDLEHQFAVGRGGIDVLLIEVQIDPDGLEVLDGLKQVDQRSA